MSIPLPTQVAVDVVRAALAICEPETTIPVATLVPNPRPDEFIQVEILGTTAQTMVSRRVDIAVKTTGMTDYDTALLSEMVSECMGEAADAHPNVLYWDPGQYPITWPDPDIPKLPRWQFTGTLIYNPAM